jgi:hypothetical protein
VAPELDLSSLLPNVGGDGKNGFAIIGAEQYELTGSSMAGVGDVNGDGVTDLVVAAPGAAAGRAYVLFGRSVFDTDTDRDGLNDPFDDCEEVANPDQRDTNGDSIGNVCDADLNDDCVVNFVDLGRMKQAFFSNDPDADLNGDGSVNFSDLGLMKTQFFDSPGPSGLPNVCEP